MPFPPTFDHVWDITTPPDTQAANLLGQDIRNLKDDIMQRISLLAGTFANRPTPETVNATWGGVGFGLLYFATDTGVIYQWNGAAWVQVNFFGANLVSSVNLTGQVANIATTTMYTVPNTVPSGTMYTVQGYLAGVGAGTMPGLTVQFTENDLNTVQNVLSFIPAGVAPPSSCSFGLDAFCPKSGTNITYSTFGYVAPMTYSVRLRLEIVG